MHPLGDCPCRLIGSRSWRGCLFQNLPQIFFADSAAHSVQAKPTSDEFLLVAGGRNGGSLAVKRERAKALSI